MEQSRRDFLFRTGCAALSAAAFSSGVEHFGLISALAECQHPSGYKALVCIFMGGGNDGNNMVIPNYTAGYEMYANARFNLAIPQGDLLSITPPSIGNPFGLHPNLSDLHTLWSQQKLAIACNVGPLVQRLTREEYRAGGPRPFQLFSHSDQVAQWQTSRSDTRSQTGWGGRVADRTVLEFNGGNPPLPMITSIAGTATFAVGLSTRPLAIAPAPTQLNQVLVLSGFNTTPEAVARRNSMDFLRTVDRQATLIRSASDLTQQTIQTSQALSTDPTLTTVFPATTLGNQLRQVAKVIKLNKESPALNLCRQIFFCSFGGFDTHQNQIGGQGNLFTQLSQAMNAFYNATVEIGYSDRVTTFTLSDFGRTLNPAGPGLPSVGTDHGWGNHAFIMGDAVRGGDFYGVPGLNGTVFPTLQNSGPDDTDSRGRWIPTAAVEQYAATLASWFGLAPADIPLVFPLIGRFPPGPNLEFMM